MGSLNTKIVTETVSEIPDVQGGPNESRPREIFGICNIISPNSLLRGSLNMNIATSTVSDVPGVLGGSYERHPLEICNIFSRNSLLGGFCGR